MEEQKKREEEAERIAAANAENVEVPRGEDTSTDVQEDSISEKTTAAGGEGGVDVAAVSLSDLQLEAKDEETKTASQQGQGQAAGTAGNGGNA